jgi:hypothetical protein
MDKIVSEVVEELGTDRLNAKELFDKYTKYKAFSSLVVREYTKIKLEISENYRKGGMEICPDLWGNQKIETEQLTEIIIRLLKEDGFYVEQGSYISASRGPCQYYLIAWDERIPAVKYAVDGPEYQKMKAMIEKPPTT